MSLADISAVQPKNKKMILKNESFLVPLGVSTIYVTACASGEDGSAVDNTYIAKAGEFCIREAIQVRPGQRIPIVVGNGDTKVGDFITLLKGAISGNYETDILGEKLGYKGNDGQAGNAGQKIWINNDSYSSYLYNCSRMPTHSNGGAGGAGGYGGAFGVGGNGAGGGGGGGNAGFNGKFGYGKLTSSQSYNKIVGPMQGTNGGAGGGNGSTLRKTIKNGSIDDIGVTGGGTLSGNATTPGTWMIFSGSLNGVTVSMTGGDLSSLSNEVALVEPYSTDNNVVFDNNTNLTKYRHDKANLGEVGGLGTPATGSASLVFPANVGGSYTFSGNIRGGNGGAGGKGADATPGYGFGYGGGSCGKKGNDGQIGNHETSTTYWSYGTEYGENGTIGVGGAGGAASAGGPGMVLIEW